MHYCIMGQVDLLSIVSLTSYKDDSIKVSLLVSPIIKDFRVLDIGEGPPAFYDWPHKDDFRSIKAVLARKNKKDNREAWLTFTASSNDDMHLVNGTVSLSKISDREWELKLTPKEQVKEKKSQITRERMIAAELGFDALGL